MPALGGRDERGTAEPVPQGLIRLGRQHRPHHLDAAGDPGEAGDQPGTAVPVVLRARTGPGTDQRPGHRDMAAERGEQQRGTPEASLRPGPSPATTSRPPAACPVRPGDHGLCRPPRPPRLAPPDPAGRRHPHHAGFVAARRRARQGHRRRGRDRRGTDRQAGLVHPGPGPGPATRDRRPGRACGLRRQRAGGTRSAPVLDEWTPALLAQLPVPDAQLVHARAAEVEQRTYLFAPSASPPPGSFPAHRPQPAELCGSAGPSGSGTRSRRSCSPGATRGPGIDAVRPGGVTEAAHHYWLDGASAPPLRWEHALR